MAQHQRPQQQQHRRSSTGSIVRRSSSHHVFASSETTGTDPRRRRESRHWNANHCQRRPRSSFFHDITRQQQQPLQPPPEESWYYGATTASSACHFWETNLPTKIFSTAAATAAPHRATDADEWDDDDWQQIYRVYRRGRSVLYPHSLTTDNVERGLQLLDRMAEQVLISRRPDHPIDGDDNHNNERKKIPMLDDPWLLRAWRDVAVDRADWIPHEAAWDDLQRTIQRIDRYIEQGVLAWNPHLLTWMLDAWEALSYHHYHHDNNKNNPPLLAEQALGLVQTLTRDYAADRPAVKYVITRLLKYLADTKANPDLANALIHRYLLQHEQLPQRQQSSLRYPEQEHGDNGLDTMDDHAYTAWVHVWAVSNRKDAGTQALEILRLAQKDQCAKGIALYDTVLHALCRSNDTVQSAILWQELQALNLPVTADTWHPLLQAYLRTQAWRQALQLWRACQTHVKTNVRPHRTARNSLTKTLERDLQQWENFPLSQNSDVNHNIMYLPDRINNWDRVAAEWHTHIEAIRESIKSPSHIRLVAALSFLDRLCLAAFFEPPPWTVSASDTDAIVDYYKRLPKASVQLRRKQMQHEPNVTLNRIVRSLRKYQGIGLVRPGGGALDFLMDGLSKASSLSPTEAAWTAENLLNDVVEDCEHDVHHPDFINKVPLLRMIKLWSETPESPSAAEAVWERLWRWYEQSGGDKRFNPDENFYKALLRAWMVSPTSAPRETAERALQLWQARGEQIGKSPSIEFCHQVTTALAEAGDVESTESLVNEAIQSYRSGETHMREDLDFVSLLILSKCRGGQLSEAAQTLDDLELRSRKNSDPTIQPSNLSYNTLLAEYSEGDEIGNALALLNRMVELAFTEPERKIHPSVSSWMTFLIALAKSDSIGAADQALKLLNRFDVLLERFAATVAPDRFMYNCILECFVRNPDPRKFVSTAESFLQHMESSKGDASPDADTYEFFLHLLVKAQHPGKASRHLERFSRLSQKGEIPAQPSTRHFHTVILGFLQRRDTKGITTAVQLVQLMHSLAMKTDWSIYPNHETYRMILQGCKHSETTDPHIAEKVLTMMEKNAIAREDGPEPVIEMYVDVISLWASKRSPEAFEHIQKLAKHIPHHRMSQDSHLYRVILDAFIKCGSIEMARTLSDAMSGIPGHCRVALEAWVEAKDTEHATRVSEQLARVESPAHLLRDSIRLWKESKLPGAGANAERLLQSLENTVDRDYSVYSDVLFSYYNSQDPDMIAATDRMVQRRRDTGGTSSEDLCFLEVAATVYLSQPNERTHERVMEIFEEIREIDDSAWFSKGKSVCSRLKAAVAGSNVKTKSILLDSLTEVISFRTHTQENETPATLL